MNTASWLSLVHSQRVIAVIRAPSLELGLHMATAVAEGGVKLIEITWNTHEAAKLIHLLRNELPACIIGAGTILTLDHWWEAIAAGSQFLFTPHINLDMIQIAVNQQVPIIPGALTPTEIVNAWQAGATAVKVFPVESLGGPTYLSHLRGPLGQIPLIPTGGITVENAQAFIKAGALAVGLSSHLFPKQAIVAENWAEITERAKTLLRSLSSPVNS